MAQVGAFPSLREMARRTVRGPINPMDKSTVVSIYPKAITFKNITLMPRIWHIEAGSIEKPALLIVGSGSWWKDVHPEEPLIEIPVGSVAVAESIVRDYINGMFGCNMGDAMPGLFFVPGEITLEILNHDPYKKLLESAIEKQTNYYRALVGYADSLWARSNGNPLTINEEMRVAARTLGKQDKDWMSDFQNVGQIRCFGCGSFKSPDYPICPSCHTIDPTHPKAALVQRAVTTNTTPLTPFGELKKEA